MADELRWVSQGFECKVVRYDKYDVNGYRFHMERHQNSWPNKKIVNTAVFTGDQDITKYYRRLQDVYELTFDKEVHHLTLVVFR